MKRTITALCCFFAGHAQAGHIVTQDVDATADGKKTHSRYEWRVDEGKFSVNVTRGASQTFYLFNGRTLYACGRLGPAQAAILDKARFKDQKLLQRIKAGACQVVPANFMVRFFVAPVTAVESVDATDGLRLTLALKDYKLKDEGKTEVLKGQPCGVGARRYTLTKTNGGATAGGMSATATVSEDFCQARRIPWRGALWTEVAKAVLRQPGGGALLAQLKADHTGIVGLPLRGEITQEIIGQDGSKHAFAVSVKVGDVKSEAIDEKRFQIPEGYALFNPEEIELGHGASQAGATVADDKPAQGVMGDAIARAAYLFCSLAGGLACIGAEANGN